MLFRMNLRMNHFASVNIVFGIGRLAGCEDSLLREDKGGGGGVVCGKKRVAQSRWASDMFLSYRVETRLTTAFLSSFSIRLNLTAPYVIGSSSWTAVPCLGFRPCIDSQYLSIMSSHGGSYHRPSARHREWAPSDS
jgi:hypothetical protein